MEYAPYYADICEGPNGAAYWLKTSDEVRIRVAVWPRVSKAQSPTKGTVFMLPGRTECAEKYGRTATELAARGYGALAIDWRGQGISDRLLDNRDIGHVGRFPDYQHDLDAVLALAKRLELPKPYFMLAHSMGGAIGLRALHRDTPFKAAAFSAPMWGIGLTPTQKIMVRILAAPLTALGLHTRFAPGTKAKTYVLANPFEGNTLTADPDMFEYMRQQVLAVPDLALGGPSTHWVIEAIEENKDLMARPAPELPMLCALGLDEQVVNTGAIRERTSTWPKARLLELPEGRHELLLEVKQTRDYVLSQACALFDAQL